MGKIHNGVDDRLRAFLLAQPVFFVATAPTASEGHLNLSPKGQADTFAVLDERTVAYLDFTGSGVETIAHLRENGRIVLMFCAFDGPPNVVRLHGRGEPVFAAEPRYAELAGHFPTAGDLGVRAIIVVALDRVSDSCGFGVPLMSYDGERSLLADWSANRGADGIARYHATRNAESIDGLPGMPAAKVPTPR